MTGIKVGCETYTWQMPGEQYKGKLEHIMAICRQAGFRGIEPETSFIQHLADPVVMQEALARNQLELAVLCVVEDWLHPQETREEKERVNDWLNFLQHFPDTMLLLVQMPQSNRDDLRTRQKNCIRCVNEISRRAAGKGTICSYHPNSPVGSVFRTSEDYEILIDGLDPSYIGYCPDVGHIAKGGMDPLDIIKKYRERVNLVHYKDMHADHRWAPTGEGTIDFDTITQYLIDTNYSGWIIMEDECDEAITDPDAVTLKDGKFIANHLIPQLANQR
ncbi:MAG: TIM barrel protein [Saprospiraceae bacterium]|nr:TIM barrel protein [Saprospiraceae bacterium]